MSRKPGQKPFLHRTVSVFLVQYPLIVIALFAVWWFFGWFYLTIGIVLVTALMLLIVVTDRKAAKNLINIAQGNWRMHMETLLYRGYDRGFMVVEAPDVKRSLQFTNRRQLKNPLRRHHFRAVETFLQQVIIEAPATERYMEFTKNITEKGVTLQFQFPSAPWSLEYYDRLQDLLKQREYHFKIWPVRPEDKFAPDIDQLIVVYLEQDLEHAVILTKLVLLEIFKLNPSDIALVWFADVSPSEEKIGF